MSHPTPEEDEHASRDSGNRGKMSLYWPPSMVDGALNAWASFVREPELVSHTVEEITGIPARPFRQWAIDHASDFR